MYVCVSVVVEFSVARGVMVASDICDYALEFPSVPDFARFLSVSICNMFPSRTMYCALLSLAMCRFAFALRRDVQARGDTEPSMRDVREIAKAAEAAGLELAYLLSCLRCVFA